MSLSWTIPSVSTPTIVLSTNAFSTAVSSGVGSLAQSSTSYGFLTPNATYWFEVKNSTEPNSDYITLSTSTLAAAPGAAAYTSVQAASLQANWTSNSNGPGVLYQAILSSGASPSTNAFSGNKSSSTANVFASFSGLSPNATYYVDVKAINNNGVSAAFTSLPPTQTLPNLPVSAGPSAVGQSQLTANWGTASNPSGTLYYVQAGADPQFSVIAASSFTLNSFAILGGLSPNTTYFTEVQAINGLGAYTAFAALPSTSTLAAAPQAAGYSAAGSNSLTAVWTSTNGLTASYQAILSSGASPGANGFSGNKSTTTTALFAVFSGLSANATYFVDVQAISNNGISTAFTSEPATATLANVPTASAASAVGSGSLTANWGTSSNPAGTLYFAKISADPSFASGAASSRTANSFAVFSGLAANTTYFLQVAAVDFSGAASAFASLPSTSTLAVPPAAAAYSSVGAGALTANWTSANGPAPSFQAILSSGASPGANGFSGNQSLTTTSTFASFTGLAADANYFVDARTINNNGIPTAFASLPSTYTLPNLPGVLPASAVGTGALTANWGSSGATYLAQLSAGSSFSTLAGSSLTANLFAAFAGLAPDTTYFMRVQALNPAGGASAFTTLPAASTLAVPPAPAAFSNVAVSSIQANWGANGNGPAPLYVAVLSTGASPGVNGFSGNRSSATFNTFAVFSGLQLTATYYVDVQAVGNGGIQTAFTSLGSTVTAQALQQAGPGQAQTISLTAPAGPIAITIGEGTFSQAVSVSAQVPASFPAAGAGLSGLGAGVQITLNPPIQPVGAATLSVGYPVPVPAGFSEGRLFLARYDEAEGVWVPLVSTVGGGQVTAQVTHFSLFQVMQASAQTGLGGVRIFPNPFRPHQGAAVTFANLPAAASLRLFNYRGRLVRRLAGDGAGMASWDGNDDSGAAAPSGVYLVVIDGGGDRRTMKLGVER